MGCCAKSITTLSLLTHPFPLSSVHVKVYVPPMEIVTEVAARLLLTKVTTPGPVYVHVPVPTDGTACS